MDRSPAIARLRSMLLASAISCAVVSGCISVTLPSTTPPPTATTAPTPSRAPVTPEATDQPGGFGPVADSQTYFTSYGFSCGQAQPGTVLCVDMTILLSVIFTGDPVVNAEFTMAVGGGDQLKLEAMARWVGRWMGSRGITDQAIVDWLANDVLAPIQLGEPVHESLQVGGVSLRADWTQQSLLADIVIAIPGFEHVPGQ